MKLKKVIALTDYKNKFGSKHFDSPYRSGMDKSVLKECFNKLGLEIEFKQFTEVINSPIINTSAIYIYTSSEDEDYLYKNFIEDAVLYLENAGCKMVPTYKYLRANNNKVFMELLRNFTKDPKLLTIQSNVYGVKEEIENVIDKIKLPAIIKTSEGASGTGVYKAFDKGELIKVVSKISSSKKLLLDIKDYFRSILHKGYIKESRNRKKFIVQNMIQDLKNDWKVYFFGEKLYVFYRPILKNRDFKASGGGYENYLYDEKAPKPNGFFEFIFDVIKHFDVPHASLDIAYDGKCFHLIEIQFLYFGTAGIPFSEGYYTKKSDEWIFIKNKTSIENVFSESIASFINKNSHIDNK